MIDSEMMTTAIIAVLRFRGNYELARSFLQEEVFPHMLSKSRFNRRLHRVQELFLTLFRLLCETWKDLNSQLIYVIDSYPIAYCDNICLSRLYKGEVWCGRQASKKHFFYGLKIHIMVTEKGQPVESFLTPGSYNDASAYRFYDFDLPQQAWITADKAYTDYDVEDAINETGMRMSPLQKNNSKRPVPPLIFYLQSTYLKIVETTGCLIQLLLPKPIHAITAVGFELKLSLFILAASLNFLWQQFELFIER